MQPRTVTVAVALALGLGWSGAARADHDTDVPSLVQVDLGARWAGGDSHLPAGPYALHLAGLYHHSRDGHRPGLIVVARIDKYLGTRDGASGLVAQGGAGVLRVGRNALIQHQVLVGLRHLIDVIQTDADDGPRAGAGGAVVGYHFQYGIGLLQVGGEAEVIGYLYGAADRRPIGVDLRVHAIVDVVLHVDWVTGAELGLGFSAQQTWL